MARAAALRRRREVLARITAVPIDVPRLDPRRLAALAGEDESEECGVAARLQVEHLWRHLWRCEALLSRRGDESLGGPPRRCSLGWGHGIVVPFGRAAAKFGCGRAQGAQ